jgi:MinD superfamily P-loop ATPase
MKQLVILSGKGGTGKTSLAAAFAHLAHAGPSPCRAVMADADVDAANLELVLHAHVAQEHEFVGGSVAVIDPGQCEGCGVCASACRFDAIREDGRSIHWSRMLGACLSRLCTRAMDFSIVWKGASPMRLKITRTC